jgi:hypothetical protein
MKKFGQKNLDVLQNIEFGIIEVYRADRSDLECDVRGTGKRGEPGVFAEPIVLIANWVVGVAPKSSHKRQGSEGPQGDSFRGGRGNLFQPLLYLAFREPLPTHHDSGAVGNVAYIFERVGFEQNQVRSLSNFDCAELRKLAKILGRGAGTAL